MSKNNFKKYILNAFELVDIYSVTRKIKEGATILFYHGVEIGIVNPIVQNSHLSLNLFEKQINYLRKNYEIVSLDYLYECIANGQKLSSSQVLITFDDGYKSNVNIVMPLLKSHNIPFTVFICTDHINSGARLPYYYLQTAIYYTESNSIEIPSIKRGFDISSREKRISVINTMLNIIKSAPQERVSMITGDLIKLLSNERWEELDALFSSEALMNWHEVKLLHDSGVVIGSHCHDHAILHSDQSNYETDFQLHESRYLVEKHLGECKYFAYPNGRMQDISNYSVESVKNNNYLLGFTTVPGEVMNNKMNRYILPRIFPGKDMQQFKFAVDTSFRKNRNYYKWCSNASKIV